MNFSNSYSRKLSYVNDDIQEEKMNIVEKNIYRYLLELNIDLLTDPMIKEEDYFKLAKERIWLTKTESTNSSPHSSERYQEVHVVRTTSLDFTQSSLACKRKLLRKNTSESEQIIPLSKFL